MLASEPASFWWDDSHHNSTTSFRENVIVVETRNFIILRSGEGLTSSNKDNSVNFSGEKKRSTMKHSGVWKSRNPESGIRNLESGAGNGNGNGNGTATGTGTGT